MNDNIINYYAFSIINSDNISIPSTGWNNFIELDLRNTWYRAIGNVYDVITALSYKNDAAYYAIFRKVPTSSGGDFQVVYIRVPYFLEIDQDSLVAALERLKVYVKDNEIQTNNGEDSQVAKIVADIIVNNSNTFSPSSYMQGTGFAYRRLGGKMNFKYNDIIKGEYQSDYNKYGVLFILDENVIPVGIDNDADLTDRAIKNHIWFSKSDLVDLGDNVSVYCGDKPFDSPIRVESNGGITLTFKKKGFEDQKQNISVADGKVKKISWKYKVTKEVFDIRDEKHNQISSFDVYLVGDRKLPQELYETELNIEQNVKIKAEGYDTLQTKVKFIPGEKTKPIIMKQKPIKCYISLKNGTNAELVFNTFHKEVIQLNGGPIWGYHATKENPFGGGDIYFRPDETLKKNIENSNPSAFKRILKIFLPIFLMLFVCWAGFVAGHIISEKNNSKRIAELEAEISKLRDNETLKEEPTSVEKKQQKEDKIEAANAYLSKNPKWNREAMEQIEPLKGVWDALNTYDYGKIMEVDGSFHFESTEWKKIITAIKAHEYMRRVGDVPICGDGDTELTISDANSANTYLGRINSAPTPKTGTTKAANTSAKKKAPEKKEEKLPDPKRWDED